MFVLILVAGLTITQAAFAATYTLTVTAGASSYQGIQPISISGQVSPNPGPNTAAVVQVFSPTGKLVLAGSQSVNASTGKFTFTGVTGGTSDWVTGTYSVNATWGAYGPQLNAKATFVYTASAASTTTTSTTTTATTTSTTTTTSSSTTTATPSTTTSSSGGGIPEFPYELSAAVVLTTIILVSYMAMRRIESGRAS